VLFEMPAVLSRKRQRTLNTFGQHHVFGTKMEAVLLPASFFPAFSLRLHLVSDAVAG
jgi:hypothetical protein